MANNSAGYPWMKFYTAWLDNPRFFRLSDLAKSVYFEIYLLAGKSDAGGLILAGDDLANITEIAYILRRDEKALRDGLTELQSIGLIILDSDQVMVTRFEIDQGPSMAEKRLAWRVRQQRNRAQAKGEKIDPELDQNSEKEKNLKKEKEKELKIKELNIKDSDKESHAEVTGVSRVTTGEGENDDQKTEKLESEILKIWNELTGQDYKSNKAFKAMINDFFVKGVTAEHFRSGFLKQQETGKMVITNPLSLQSWAINARTKRAVQSPEVEEIKRQERFRQLARELEQKQDLDQDA